MTGVTLKEIRKSYGQVKVLHGIDLDIKPVSYTHLTLPTILRV